MPSRTWSWNFAHPPEAIWPLLADTARFNEAAGLPRYTVEEIPRPDGSVAYFGQARFGPFDLRWEEHPVNWVAGQWFEHCRSFLNGPLLSLCAHFVLEAEGSGSRGRYTVTAEPRNLLGRLILATGFFRSAERNFSRLAREADLYAGGERAQPFPYVPPKLSADLKAKIDRLVAEIEASPNGHGLARRLADFVLESQEVDLWHIRPLLLAKRWQVPELSAIELCLQAVKTGLLELRWDLLCPRCRVAKASALGLDRLPQGAHCPSCNIDYDRDFSRNVEASFRPAAAIRPLLSGEYCLWGPMSTPHVAAQIHLAPGETKSLDAQFPPGPYRWRSLEPGPEIDCEVSGDAGMPSIRLMAAEIAAIPPAAPGKLTLENRDSRPRIALLESRHWVADALTADRLTSLQIFRDLFSADVLRPGDEVAIAGVTLLFSDLKGSTALYQAIGDARAYHLVRDHFAFLARVIRAHEGAIVKTIGDAVMAAFRNPADGIEAALDIQQGIADFNRAHGAAAGPALVIKLGLHQGPSIAVTLNDRLDYFGSTVNMAARLQGQSQGGDIVISAEMASDEGVKDRLAGFALEEDRALLKGFAQPLLFYRLKAV